MTKLIEELAAELIRQAYAEGYKQGKSDAERVGKIRGTIARMEETPQQARDRIVEQAKKDVEELKCENSDFYEIGKYACTADFIVNKEKRTVVALLRGYSSNVVRVKGIAKCAPGDCFNVWIGKAIALRRALGLEVPAEYLNAPNPTEVRVGDIICGADDESFYRTSAQYTVTSVDEYGTVKYAEDPLDWINAPQIGRIIDDSREEGTE